MESAESMLAIVARPDRRAGRAAVDAALALAAAIGARDGAHPLVGARILLHLDRVERIEDWMPAAGGSGVLASRAVAELLDLDVEPGRDAIQIAPPGTHR